MQKRHEGKRKKGRNVNILIFNMQINLVFIKKISLLAFTRGLLFSKHA